MCQRKNPSTTAPTNERVLADLSRRVVDASLAKLPAKISSRNALGDPRDTYQHINLRREPFGPYDRPANTNGKTQTASDVSQGRADLKPFNNFYGPGAVYIFAKMCCSGRELFEGCDLYSAIVGTYCTCRLFPPRRTLDLQNA